MDETTKTAAPAAPAEAAKEETAASKGGEPRSVDTEREVPAKFKSLVGEIEKLSVLDLAELVKALEEKFGVSAAAPQVAVAAAPVAGGVDVGADAGEEKSSFNVELKAVGDKKIEVIKVVRDATQKGLKEAGFDLGKTNSPVTPVYLNGGEAEATNLVYDLRENYGIFCSMIVYPVIPKGELILRLIPTAMHTLEDVEYTLKAFKEVRKKLEGGAYDKNKLASVKVDM